MGFFRDIWEDFKGTHAGLKEQSMEEIYPNFKHSYATNYFFFIVSALNETNYLNGVPNYFFQELSEEFKYNSRLVFREKICCEWVDKPYDGGPNGYEYSPYNLIYKHLYTTFFFSRIELEATSFVKHKFNLGIFFNPSNYRMPNPILKILPKEREVEEVFNYLKKIIKLTK